MMDGLLIKNSRESRSVDSSEPKIIKQIRAVDEGALQRYQQRSQEINHPRFS